MAHIPKTPLDYLKRARTATDPLAPVRDALDPPHLKMLREHMERDSRLRQGLEARSRPLMGIAELAEKYRSPNRDMLDALGAPRAVQRVMASAVTTPSSPARTHALDDAAIVGSVADIGKRVRAARKAMGMTQQRFADLAGVGRRFLVELEQGKRSLEIGRVLAVCKAAGLKLVFAP